MCERFKNKLHYVLKYFILSLPLLSFFVILLGHAFDISVTDNVVLSNFNSVVSWFINLEINSWYNSLLEVLTFDDVPSILNVLVYYPVYVLWVYLFDIVLDFIVFIPKFLNNLYEKVSD